MSLLKNRKLIYISFFTLFIISSVFLFWRCKYGFGNFDESYYLALVYRLYQGDSLLVNEWNGTQLFSFLLYPFFKVYMLFAGTTEGVILSFRYIFTAVWCTATIFFFYRLRNISLVGALVGSLMFMLFTPHSVMALSYQSIGLLCYLLCLIIAFTSKRFFGVQYFFSGLFFAAAVICSPFFAFFYFFFTVFVMLTLFFKTKEKYTKFRYYWIYQTVGILFLFTVFAVFLFSRTSLNDVINSIPVILQLGGSLHRSIFYLFAKFFYSVFQANYFSLPILCLYLVLLAVGFKKLLNKRILFLSACGLTIFYLISGAVLSDFPNYAMFPLSTLGFYCFLNSKDNPKIRKMFFRMYLPGVAYAICIYLVSNQFFKSCSIAFAVSSISSVFIVLSYIEELFLKSKKLKDSKMNENNVPKTIVAAVVSVLFIAQISTEAVLRYKHVFFEAAPMSEMTSYINYGPEKGIYASKALSEGYDYFRDDVNRIRNSDADQVLLMTPYSVLYLATEKKNSSYSAWVWYDDRNRMVPILEKYYELCDYKKPDLVYVESNFADCISSVEQWGYKIVERTKIGGTILVKEK